MIACRDAIAGDAAAIAALARATFTETFGHLYAQPDLDAFLAGHDAESWAAQIDDPLFAVRLAEDDGRAVAYAKLGPPALPVDLRGPTIELRQLYVAASHQGAGVGRTLLGWALAKARRRGAVDLNLSVYVDNHRARAIYERLGFERVGTYAFMVGTHADEDDVMRLRL